MILYIATAFTALAVLALFVFPTVGVCLTLLLRPLIDTTYADKLIGKYGLTELIGVAVPIAVFAFAAIRAGGAQRFSRIPLFPLWIVYVLDLLFFSALLTANEGIETAANIFFRQLNLAVAFYLPQAFFRDDRSRLLFFRTLLLATLFPMAVGFYQLFTGYQWTRTDTEGITRYVGLYHDAFTVRFYMLQGILAAIVMISLRPGQRVLQKLLLMLFIAGALVVVFRAYSKSAVATLLVWALLWCIFRRRFLALGLLSAAAALLVGVYFPELLGQVGQMFHKEIGALTGHGDLSHTFAGRWYGWYDLLAKWSELDGFAQVFGSHTAVGAHNDYLMILMHAGIFGLGIYLLLLLSVGVQLIRNAFSRADPIAVAGLMAFALWCIDSIGLVPSSYPGYQWFVWGVIGMSLRMRADERLGARANTVAAKAAPLRATNRLMAGRLPQAGS